ncbi:MAG: hypothetical protein A3F12_03325 [Gammaproteobacteria bacterium RIFCSPHIGHO2_12_FULL_38_14]|nr:MAG: hypothetical protein A3F12_03325 [Gammaproteobacteria bacterium RIFCSPHIGHO2_12_FULL_38_14]
MPWLINASQLDKLRKDQKNVIVLDASWHLHQTGRDAKAEFLKSHIIGARFIDLNNFFDASNPLPNMLLHDEVLIGERIAALGITNEHKIIFYDQSDCHTSCRALWMFKVFGHALSHLYILDGGFGAWERYAGKIETGEGRAISPKPYIVRFESQYIRTLLQMKMNLHHPKEQVVDMRHAIRFAGGQEMRPGIRVGHIPGSFSFPFMTMFETDGRFKPLEKIQKQLLGIGIDLHYPIVTMCGSGMTASILTFVLDLLNHPQHSLYDGSWSEWGAEILYPGEESLAERPVRTSLE